jgi:hypothetical protein
VLATAEESLPFSKRSFVVQGEEMRGFQGQHSGSSKIADLALQIKTIDDELETKLVFEIGVSQDYNEPLKDMRLWLEGIRSVNTCQPELYI